VPVKTFWAFGRFVLCCSQTVHVVAWDHVQTADTVCFDLGHGVYGAPGRPKRGLNLRNRLVVLGQNICLGVLVGLGSVRSDLEGLNMSVWISPLEIAWYGSLRHVPLRFSLPFKQGRHAKEKERSCLSSLLGRVYVESSQAIQTNPRNTWIGRF
jgi:hypothetical protein